MKGINYLSSLLSNEIKSINMLALSLKHGINYLSITNTGYKLFSLIVFTLNNVNKYVSLSSITKTGYKLFSMYVIK